MRYLYSVCLALILPFLWLRLWWRYRHTDYNQRWRERWGYISIDSKLPILWLHAASVGEVIASQKLIERLITHYPQYNLLITTTTPTGAKRVTELFANKVTHRYWPYDLPHCISRFLRSVKPVALLLVETELWPNMLAACDRLNITSILINGRMSARSYHAYRRVACLSEPMFAQLSIVVAQTATDAKRFQQLGAQHITVSGNIKMDSEIKSDLREKAEILAARWSDQGQRTVLIAASTHPGEDEQLLSVLKILKQSAPQIRLVLVPRHSQRFDTVKTLCLQKEYHVRCHSENKIDSDTDIIVGDTMGELMVMYGASDIAFVGGSLIDNGGHNVLEPAAWGLPIVTGPSVYNFTAIVDGLAAVGGIHVVQDNQQLLKSLQQLIKNPALRKKMSHAAYHYVESNRGALEKLLNFLKPTLNKIPRVLGSVDK